jgi:hypothetical protein
MTQTKTSRNRRSPRLPVRLPARWIRRQGTSELEARDINLHGMFLSTDEPRPPGSLLQIEVTLPTGLVTLFVTVQFVGTTVSGHGMGVEIFLMSPRHRNQWTTYYRSLLGSRTVRPAGEAYAPAPDPR